MNQRFHFIFSGATFRAAFKMRSSQNRRPSVGVRANSESAYDLFYIRVRIFNIKRVPK